MNPAEGRKLLETHEASGDPNGDLAAWLWTHREELIRCAERVAELEREREEPAPAAKCPRCGVDYLDGRVCSGSDFTLACVEPVTEETKR